MIKLNDLVIDVPDDPEKLEQEMDMFEEYLDAQKDHDCILASLGVLALGLVAFHFVSKQ
jgi:hypothetical protein